jgi:hypothetical protein
MASNSVEKISLDNCEPIASTNYLSDVFEVIQPRAIFVDIDGVIVPSIFPQGQFHFKLSDRIEFLCQMAAFKIISPIAQIVAEFSRILLIPIHIIIGRVKSEIGVPTKSFISEISKVGGMIEKIHFFPPNLDRNVKNYYRWKAKIITESKFLMLKTNKLKKDDFAMIIDDDRDLLVFLAESLNDQYLIYMHCEI